MVNPYVEYIGSGYLLRVFYEDVMDEELVWHRDKEDREVEVISGVGWKLQMDNQLPEELEEGKIYSINKMEYHRLIKGNGTLRLKIREKRND